MIERHYRIAKAEADKLQPLGAADESLVAEWCYYAKMDPAGLNREQKDSIIFSVKNNTVTPFTNSVLLDLKARGITIKFD